MLLGGENECPGIIMFFSKFGPQSTRVLKGILLDIGIDKLSLAAVKEKSINLWSFWPNLGPNFQEGPHLFLSTSFCEIRLVEPFVHQAACVTEEIGDKIGGRRWQNKNIQLPKALCMLPSDIN